MTNLAHMYGTCGSSEPRVPVLAPTKQAEVAPPDHKLHDQEAGHRESITVHG